MKIVIIFNVLIIFCVFPIWGIYPEISLKDCEIDSWDITDGLPSDTIYSIAQSGDGFLWIATAKGLVRFDGIEFERIEMHLPVKDSQGINKLFIDKKGVLWLAGGSLLGKYEKNQLIWFPIKDKLGKNWITCILDNLEGKLWIVQYPNLLYFFEGDNLEKCDTLSREEHYTISDMILDQNGRLLIGLEEKGIFVFEEGALHPFINPQFLRGIKIYALLKDYGEYLWIGTNKGLICRKKNINRFFSKFEGLSDNRIELMMEDKHRTIWVGTYRGLNRIKRTLLGETIIEKCLETEIITSLSEDLEGNLWVATNGSGLKRIRIPLFKTYSIQEGLPDNYILSICESPEGKIWVGAKYGGVFQLEKNIFSPIRIGDFTLKKYSLVTFLKDKNGFFWIGAYGYGLVKYDYLKEGINNPTGKSLDSSRTSNMRVESLSQKQLMDLNYLNLKKNGDEGSRDKYATQSKIPNGNITSQGSILYTRDDGLMGTCFRVLIKDSEGNLWIGTEGGINLFDGHSFIRYTTKDGLLHKAVNNIFEDKRHCIWIATSRGINRIKKENSGIRNIDSILKGIPIYFIREGEEDYFWIGTKGKGIIFWGTEKTIHITKENGLGSNTVYHMLEDETGNAWFSSDSGVLKVNKQNLVDFCQKKTNEIHCTTYGFSDGLKGIDCVEYKSSAVRTQNGDMWFATKRGLSVVNPNNQKRRELPLPFALVRKVNVDGEDFQMNSKGIPNTFSGKKLEVYFTAPFFTSPERVYLKYKLEEVDPEWVLVGRKSNQKVVYNDLESGDYIFQIKACNSNGQWNPLTSSYNISWRSENYNNRWLLPVIFFFFLGILIHYLYIAKKRNLLGVKKSKSSILDMEKADIVHKKLLYSLDVDKVYCDEDLSLKTLAQKLEIPSYFLSQVINEKCNKNFFELINFYRIEEAKKQLTSPQLINKKIINIAYDVGFNTKVAFNKSFKKFVNMTPSQYRREYQVK